MFSTKQGFGGSDSVGNPLIFTITLTTSTSFRFGGMGNYFIDWGDGDIEYNIVNSTSTRATHTYSSTGTYTISVSGRLKDMFWNVNDTYNLNSIKELNQWGDIYWQSLNIPNWGIGKSNGFFSYITNPNFIPSPGTTTGPIFVASEFQDKSSDIPKLQYLGDCDYLLAGVTSYNTTSTSNWDMTRTTSTAFLFADLTQFNQDISNWNVANVTNMRYMFYNCDKFFYDLNSWNVSKVTRMDGMFRNALLGAGTSTYTFSLNSWNVANVVNMSEMFRNSYFNGNIGAWNVGNVANMSSMFQDADIFNQDISGWNVSNVTNMSAMFEAADVFNQDISSWNVSNVANMQEMFTGCPVFNQNISIWNTAKVTNMSSMFNNADAFNQDISSWNVGNVANLNNMFTNANAFNQNLGSWALRKTGVTLISIFSNSGMSTSSYSQTLIGWANYVYNNNAPKNVNMSGQTNMKYNNINYGGSPFSNAVAARAFLTASTGGNWTITGDALV